jgi:hypothetical protein
LIFAANDTVGEGCALQQKRENNQLQSFQLFQQSQLARATCAGEVMLWRTCVQIKFELSMALPNRAHLTRQF